MFVTYRIAVFAQWSKLFLWIDDQSVSRHDTLLVVVHNSDESIGGWLGANSDAGEISVD